MNVTVYKWPWFVCVAGKAVTLLFASSNGNGPVATRAFRSRGGSG